MLLEDIEDDCNDTIKGNSVVMSEVEMALSWDRWTEITIYKVNMQ